MLNRTRNVYLEERFWKRIRSIYVSEADIRRNVNRWVYEDEEAYRDIWEGFAREIETGKDFKLWQVPLYASYMKARFVEEYTFDVFVEELKLAYFAVCSIRRSVDVVLLDVAKRLIKARLRAVKIYQDERTPGYVIIASKAYFDEKNNFFDTYTEVKSLLWFYIR